MPTVKIVRKVYTDKGTKGLLTIEGTSFALFTMENPWLDNKKQLSCIPNGTYECEITQSPKFGKVYAVKNVPGRTHILFHKGNSPADTLGCILLGLNGNINSDQMWVSSSNLAFEAFYQTLKYKAFTLVIEDDPNADTYRDTSFTPQR